MNARAAKIKWTLLAGLFCLLAAGRAQAQTACATDLDCPDSACGGQVCTHSSGGTLCAPAGERGNPGADGWCANSTGNPDDNNCKCKAQGATCGGFSCSFTMAPDGSVTGTGGATGTGGGGATGTGGSGTGGSGTGGTSAGTSGGGGGGCSVAGAPIFGGGGAVGVTLLLAALIRRRARRR